MIVVRHIWVIRDGHTRDQAMALWKEFPPLTPEPARVFGSGSFSPSAHTLVFEFQFDDLATYAKLNHEWMLRPEMDDLMSRWLEICETNSHKMELWRVLE